MRILRTTTYLLMLATALLGAHSTAVGADKSASNDASTEIRKELESARAALTSIEASPSFAAGAPASATEEELKTRRYFVRERVRSLEILQRNLQRKNTLQSKLDELSQKDESLPSGLTPPYSILLADRIRDEIRAAHEEVESKKTRQDLIRGLRETLSASVKNAMASERQAEEQLAGSHAGNKAALEWSLELTRQRARSHSAILRSLELSEEVSGLEISVARAQLKQAEQRLAQTEGKTDFPEQDYRHIKSDLTREANLMSRELLRQQDAAAAANTRLEKARQALAQRQAELTGSPNAPGAPVQALEAAILMAEGEVATINFMLDSMRFNPGIFEIKGLLWDYRFRLAKERSSALAAEAKGRIANFTVQLAQLRKVNERQLHLLLNGSTERTNLPTGDGMARIDLSSQQTDRERVLRANLALIDSTQRLIDNLGRELGIEGGEAHLGARAETSLLFAWNLLASAWDFELFAVEDTVQVDGKAVTSLASVTIGKVLRAIFLFTAGVLFTLYLSRLLQGLAVRHFRYDPTQARILSKWLFALGLIILLISVLLWVNIPLTVFAFLGGAVAIGLGFGMQNLLKNLICGLMLLFERPFRPGDMIEVGNVTGRVTEIGIRSSTVRDPNGIDTLIPNSTFIEQNVTNWTYDNPRVRFCIKIGVAYGSPAREVAEMLADCVKRHGLVLADPKPEILFANFGADALEFEIYFWVDIVSAGGHSSREISSDLRFIIEKRLSENGIVIAYPQRDVHLDVSRPLPIELVGRQAGTPP